MEGYTVCGGLKVDSTSTSCTTFSSGQWVTSHALAEKRDSSCSWATVLVHTLIFSYLVGLLYQTLLRQCQKESMKDSQGSLWSMVYSKKIILQAVAELCLAQVSLSQLQPRLPSAYYDPLQQLRSNFQVGRWGRVYDIGWIEWGKTISASNYRFSIQNFLDSEISLTFQVK